MARKIDAKNIGILAVSTTALSTAFGLIGSYALHRLYPYSSIDTGLNVALSWCAFHAPVTLAAVDSLRQELGLKSPITIIGNSFSSGRSRRKIPFSANGKDSTILMSTIPFLKTNIKKPEFESFTVRIDNVDYTVTLVEMENFIRAAWNRQRNGKLGLSRTYWTKQRQPRLKTLEYNIRMHVLLSVSGLVLDRSQGRSGRLAISPLLTIQALV
jgi:hypothetical protein